MTPSTECGAAGLAAKRLDLFCVTMHAIPNQGMNVSVCDPEVRALSVGAGEPLGIDAFAAMTTSRPYQAARSMSVAWQELERGAGTQFDPLLVQQCIVSLEASRELPSRREEQPYANTCI